MEKVTATKRNARGKTIIKKRVKKFRRHQSDQFIRVPVSPTPNPICLPCRTCSSLARDYNSFAIRCAQMPHCNVQPYPKILILCMRLSRPCRQTFLLARVFACLRGLIWLFGAPQESWRRPKGMESRVRMKFNGQVCLQRGVRGGRTVSRFFDGRSSDNTALRIGLDAQHRLWFEQEDAALDAEWIP